MKIELIRPNWQDVFTIPKDTQLIKGRHGVYHNLRKAASKAKMRFGCYSWQSNNVVHYCGSFAKDYGRKEFKSNLEGRIHNYWQNHRVNKNGHKNTNKHVFDSIQLEVDINNVRLCILNFNELILDNTTFSYEEYVDDSNIVKAVEALLICHYRRLKQCCWNRS